VGEILHLRIGVVPVVLHQQVLLAQQCECRRILLSLSS